MTFLGLAVWIVVVRSLMFGMSLVVVAHSEAKDTIQTRTLMRIAKRNSKLHVILELLITSKIILVHLRASSI